MSRAFRAKKVIIDTDIGDDIDDALALYLAMKSPELEILGVTTVFKETYKRAQIATRLLRLEGLTDVPVVPGIRRPIVNRSIFGRSINFDDSPRQYLEEMMNETVNTSISALDFLANTVMQSPEPVSLITLGALTNVAVLLLSRPEVAKRIEKIFVMGGAYNLNINEYNFACDPEAAKFVLSSGVKVVVVGLDVTLHCVLSDAALRTIMASGGATAELIGRMRRYWPSDSIHLHDPLAVAAAFRDDLVRLEQMKVDVETQGSLARGMAINLSGMNWGQDPADSNVWVSVDVDAGRFVRFYVNRLLGNEQF